MPVDEVPAADVAAARPGEVRSFSALVRRAADAAGAAPALVAGDVRLSWAELDARVDRAAAGYRARGLDPGERVAVQLRNGVDWVVAVMGALRAGLVVVPVNTAFTDPETEHLLGDSGARLLVVGTPREELAGVPVSVGPPASDDPAPADPEDPDALALLAYTSGTTGRPRGAMLTHAALLANQQQLLGLDPAPVRTGDRVLLVLPLFHVYGLNAGWGLVAETAACAVLVEEFDPAATLRLMAEEEVTAVPGAPPMYAAWLAVADAAGSDAALRRGFAAVRTASCGAAPMPGALFEAMRTRAAVTVWEGYGLTEAGPVLTSTLATGRAKPECIGGPLPGVELVLRDTAGGPTAGPDPGSRVRQDVFGDPFAEEDGESDADEAGEICARGPNLFSGFWPDGADGPDAAGWLPTGDIAYRDADGDLRLVDRRRDLVLVSGFNVYPGEVERVLDEHPDVAESAVIGVPDPRTGEAVHAVVVRTPDGEVTEEQLREHAARSLARFKVPVGVHFVAELPHSLAGKVSRARLRELGLERAAAAAAAAEETDG
ncbi:Acyl-CoA synthetase (AMP-forming)/AMP-acid ligase [Modestobacter italicus]|uniref:Acyl-CoA synthetase (AMP-forming)/AMP-acid ligase n=1 Tax=Modestobacter italicus (strain DSM 44449 / CECT 9708 / BC 501) TaxID=2732864 RepID=I4F415_MODI5|nr:AMP-binding protein [Modestobacter marinus]CCH90378.1 Acyl-CoA synthetase (AMP-forming)/AMP-acid ligase [Modestobacter marinus]